MPGLTVRHREVDPAITVEPAPPAIAFRARSSAYGAAAAESAVAVAGEDGDVVGNAVAPTAR